MKNDKETPENIRDIRNDIQEIKTDTGTINRILVMTHLDVIIEDLIETIGGNERRAVLLYILNEFKTISQIQSILGIGRTQVYYYLKSFIDKDYVYSKKKGRVVEYKRIEILDKVGYSNIPQIKTMIQEWKKEKE